MFERVTTNLRSAVVIANQETLRLQGDIIGDVELLIGLAKETRGIGHLALHQLGVDLQMLQRDLERQPRSMSDGTAQGRLPQTVEFKRAFEAAVNIARDMGDAHIGTEHALLGLLRHLDFASSIVLAKHSVSFERARQSIVTLRGIADSTDGTANADES